MVCGFVGFGFGFGLLFWLVAAAEFCVLIGFWFLFTPSVFVLWRLRFCFVCDAGF